MSLTSDITALVRNLTAPLQRRVRLMVSRALVELVKDTTRLQELQLSVRADELRDGVERFQQYGFTSVPAPGAEAIILLVGGSGDHPVAIAVENRLLRPVGLPEGVVALYTADGVLVKLSAGPFVDLGQDPTSPAAYGDRTEQRLQALELHATTHNHPTGVGPSGVTATPLPPGQPVSATQVRIK